MPIEERDHEEGKHGVDELHEHTIQSLVTKLSLTDKLKLISGDTMWTLASRTLVQEKFPKLYSVQENSPAPSALSTPPPLPFRVSDGPHGLRKTVTDEASCLESVPATCFPTATAVACSWDEDLVYQVGQALAVEARNHHVDVILGPAMNIQRHPFGGRSFEYFSEDPLLTGRLATAMVHGIQQQPPSPTDPNDPSDSTAVGACIKHVCVNNQESRRFAVNVVVDDRTLREIYLRGFEHVVRGSGQSGCSVELKQQSEGGKQQQQQQLEKRKDHLQPWAMMCAYNKLNGISCSEHKWLFQDVIRKEWGFDGLVLTDWGATNDRVEGIKAGIDLEMPASGSAHHEQILEVLEDENHRADFAQKDNNNQVSLQQSLDQAVARNLKLLFKASPPQQQLTLEGKDQISNMPHTSPMNSTKTASILQVHHDLACRVARDCTVLLKNEDNFLPFNKDETPSIAVVGAFAKTCPRFQGMGSSQVNPYKVDTLWSALQEVRQREETTRENVIDLLYAQGYDPNHVEDVHDDVVDGSLLQEAMIVAQQAAVCILMIGVPEGCESEGFDRTTLELPLQHTALVEAICGANHDDYAGKNSNTIVILCNGGPVTMPWVNHPKAILEGFLPGQGGGRALLDLLFGVVSPCAKLATTFPLSFQDVPAHANFPGKGNQVEYREGLNVGYRYFCSALPAAVPVLFPFGHGLSYATFDYHSNEEMTVSVDKDHPTEKRVTVRFPLTNSSNIAFTVPSREIVQCYVHACYDTNNDGTNRGCTVYRPDIELKEFCKTPLLSPGETCWITMTLTTKAFSFWDVGVSDWVVEPGRYQLRIGASCQDIRLEASVLFVTGRSASFQARESHPPWSKTNSDTETYMNTGLSDATFSKMLGYDIPKLGSDHGCEHGGGSPKVRLVMDRNSLLQDVAAASWIGATLKGIVWRITCRQLQQSGGRTVLLANNTYNTMSDGEVKLRLQSENPEMMKRVAYAIVQNLPLRGLVLFAQGKLSFRVLDFIIAVVNGSYGQALGLFVWGKSKPNRRQHS
jgi:beta-glucosidase